MTTTKERENMKNLNELMVPGTKVQLSGRFLRSTGQQLGGEGQSKWIVEECPCRICQTGDYLATNEEKEDVSYFDPEELKANPQLAKRHFARSNLVIVGKPSVRND